MKYLLIVTLIFIGCAAKAQKVVKNADSLYKFTASRAVNLRFGRSELQAPQKLMFEFSGNRFFWTDSAGKRTELIPIDRIKERIIIK